jgi:hypothetical protein
MCCQNSLNDILKLNIKRLFSVISWLGLFRPRLPSKGQSNQAEKELELIFLSLLHGFAFPYETEHSIWADRKELSCADPKSSL